MCFTTSKTTLLKDGPCSENGLYAGHAGKQVRYKYDVMITYYSFERLQKLNVCMSHQVTSEIIERLGLNHDREVVRWREEMLRYLNEEVWYYRKTKTLQDYMPGPNVQHCFDHTFEEDVEGLSISSTSTASISAPGYSPVVSESEMSQSSTGTEGDPDVQSIYEHQIRRESV